MRPLKAKKKTYQRIKEAIFIGKKTDNRKVGREIQNIVGEDIPGDAKAFVNFRQSGKKPVKVNIKSGNAVW